MLEKDLIYRKLWEASNTLRGHMDCNEFKDYILPIICYKYLSENTNLINKEEYKFKFTIKNIELNTFDLNTLVMYLESLNDNLKGLFNVLLKCKEDLIRKLFLIIDEIPSMNSIDILGNVYEYLIRMFSSNSGKKGGEFYTPLEVTELLCKLCSVGVNKEADVYDPTCGSGFMLLKLKDYVKVNNFYGQELNTSSYNISRMNMLIHNIDFDKFHLYNGDTLEEDGFEGRKFDIQVANPPYSAKWSADNKFNEDERFNVYGKLAPKSKADFAFLQHMIYHMEDDGRIAILLPHGVLFRGAAEKTIRKYIIEEQNYLDAVIGLPANLFFGTNIPVCLLLLKKNRESNKDNIFFIDASKDFEPGKKQNILRKKDIDKIVESYVKREDIEKYAHKATMDEIKENDFNLNIPRYVDTFEEEPKVDLDAEFEALAECMRKSDEIDGRLEEYFEELGLRGFKVGGMS